MSVAFGECRECRAGITQWRIRKEEALVTNCLWHSLTCPFPHLRFLRTTTSTAVAAQLRAFGIGNPADGQSASTNQSDPNRSALSYRLPSIILDSNTPGFQIVGPSNCLGVSSQFTASSIIPVLRKVQYLDTTTNSYPSNLYIDSLTLSHRLPILSAYRSLISAGIYAVKHF